MFLRRPVQQLLRKQANLRMTAVRAFGSGHDHHDEHHAPHDPSAWVNHPVNFLGRTIPNNSIADAVAFDGTKDFRPTMSIYTEVLLYALTAVGLYYTSTQILSKNTEEEVNSALQNERYIKDNEFLLNRVLHNGPAPLDTTDEEVSAINLLDTVAKHPELFPNFKK